MSKAVVLFSGGQDSTTCLGLATRLYDEVVAVSVRYGQRHAAELDAARAVVAVLAARGRQVRHVELSLDALQQLGDSALLRAGDPILVKGGYADLAAQAGLPTSFVPGRNALLLTLAAAVAVREGARDVVSGVCQTDYSGYPDCRRPFVDALELALNLGLPSGCGPLRLVTPLMHMTKAETVRLARRLGPDVWEALGRSLTCYQGSRPGCGQCPACELRARGFREAGEPDPAQEATS